MFFRDLSTDFLKRLHFGYRQTLKCNHRNEQQALDRKEMYAMRKNVIYAVPAETDRSLCLDFFYRSDGDGQFLFFFFFGKCIHRYFTDGKSFRQLLEHRDWLRNPRLANLIEGRLWLSSRRYFDSDRKERTYAG